MPPSSWSKGKSWTKDGIGDSGWRSGWNITYIQSYDEDTDTIINAYPSEPECTYDLSTTIEEKKIKLIHSVM